MHAAINPAAMETVADLTAGTFPECLTAVLQNARRAQATRVDIRLDGNSITVTDNGHGILDQDTLLNYGTPSWTPRIDKEDPAGIGLFTLADHNVVIRTRTVADNDRPSKRDIWTVRLTPTMFRGRERTRPEYGGNSPETVGTAVTFDTDGLKPWLVEHMVLHFPVETYLNGKPAQQEPFLKDPDNTIDWNGFRIGLYRGQPGIENRSSVSFHGTMASLPIPSVRGNPYAKAELVNCPARHLLEQPGLATVKDNALSQALMRKIEYELQQRFANEKDA